MALDRAQGRQDRLRQARQRPPRLRARPRRRVRAGDARGARRGRLADDRLRLERQMGRHDGRAARPGDGGVRPRLDRGAARRLGSRGLREPAREDDDPDRLRREGVDARRVRAGARDRHRRRRRRRPGSGRGDHRASAGLPTGSRPIDARPTRTPGRRRSVPRRASRSPSRRRPASCSSSSRCATRCSTTSSPSRSSTSTAGSTRRPGPGSGSR